MKIKQIGKKQAYIITDNSGAEALQSYNTIVAVRCQSGIYIYDYGSVTTSTHIRYFLGQTSKEWRKKLKENDYHNCTRKEIQEVWMGC